MTKYFAIRTSLIGLSCIITLIISVEGCKKSDNTGTQNVNTTASDDAATARYIFTEKGLNMREKPDEKSKKIDTIGFGEKVKFISEEKDEVFLMGEYGKWTQVSWKDKTGWVFGGYLRNHDPLLLKKVAAEHYNAIWKKYIEDWFKSYGKGKTLTKDIKKRYNQTEKDITIETVLGDFAVVTHWTDDMQGDVTGFENGHRSDVWQYENGTWRECKMIKSNFAPDPEVKAAKVKLFYLNDDKFPDYIAYGGCCDNLDVYVMLGKENKSFEQLSKYGGIDSGYEIIAGKCEKAILRIPGINAGGTDTSINTYKFDCKTNKFVQVQ
jgi:hypothetical protein